MFFRQAACRETSPPASPARLAARAATRPVKGARVVLTPAGGAPITVKTDAQGRFSADVPPGKVAITLPGRSGRITPACTTATIDADVNGVAQYAIHLGILSIR